MWPTRWEAVEDFVVMLFKIFLAIAGIAFLTLFTLLTLWGIFALVREFVVSL